MTTDEIFEDLETRSHEITRTTIEALHRRMDEAEMNAKLPDLRGVTIPRGAADEDRDRREAVVDGRITSRPVLPNFHD